MISISNLTVSTKAAGGATVGTLTMMNAGKTALAANFTLTEDAGGFFGISGSNLVTEISGIAPGFMLSGSAASPQMHIMLTSAISQLRSRRSLIGCFSTFSAS